jgi:hypothetical protein
MNGPVTGPSGIAPGSRVEVFVSYAGSWSPAFEVIDVGGEDCHLRRVSDGVTLPEPIRLDRVRPLSV